MKIRKASHERILLMYAFGISGVLIGLGGFIFGSSEVLSLLIYGLVLIGGIQYLVYAYRVEEEGQGEE